MHTALQYRSSRPLAEGFDFRESDCRPSQRAPVFDILVTRFAEEQRLPFQGDHPLDPERFWPSRVFVEFSHGLYMMDLHIF